MHGIIIWPTNLCLSNMCMPISYIHIISYNHCCTINVLGWKCKHNSSTLPPRCLKHCRLFSISHTSFGIASRGQCGWSLHDTWKIITYEPTSRRHQPNKISSNMISSHHIQMKEIWRSAPLETDLIETRRKKHTINYQQEASLYYQPTQCIGRNPSKFTIHCHTWMFPKIVGFSPKNHPMD